MKSAEQQLRELKFFAREKHTNKSIEVVTFDNVLAILKQVSRDIEELKCEEGKKGYPTLVQVGVEDYEPCGVCRAVDKFLKILGTFPEKEKD